MTKLHGYRFHVNYMGLTIWTFNERTRAVTDSVTFKPMRGKSREERYRELAAQLRARKVPVPAYRGA